MELPENTIEVNLCGAMATPLVLAQIANALETGNPVLVCNAGTPYNGHVGYGAFMIGQAQAMLDVEDLRKRLEAVESLVNV